MYSKKIPFSNKKISEIVAAHETPFYLYDEAGIIASASKLKKSFDWVYGFKEYFAVKATPNPYILSILKNLGLGADCSSMAELFLAEKTGIAEKNIMFSSNDTPVEEYIKASQLGAIINLDDISHISFIEKNIGIPDVISLRYNPGGLKKGNTIIGHPEQSKFGMTREQVVEGLKILQDKGAKELGLHIMVASNELDPHYFVDTARLMFEFAAELYGYGIQIGFINLGGGIGIPYYPTENPVDVEYVGREIRKEYDKIILSSPLHPLKIFLEMGRSLTGPHGYLVSKALHIKKSYKKFVGVDANMANLMRPGMYGAYHHITILGKENEKHEEVYDVVGSLCENNDKFAIDRHLPEAEVGDIFIFHDTGAHGHAMGFNYNGKLRSAELLVKTDGSVQMIRRKESLEDYFATIDFSGIVK